MTESEFRTIRALDKCRCGHRQFDRRFISDLRRLTVRDRAARLTRRQQYTLASIAYRYRRQLVRWLPSGLVPSTPPDEAAFGLHGKPETINDLFTGEPSPPHHGQDHESPPAAPQRELL